MRIDIKTPLEHNPGLPNSEEMGALGHHSFFPTKPMTVEEFKNLFLS